MEEGISILERDFRDLDRAAEQGGTRERATLHALGEGSATAGYLARVRGDLLDERLDAGNLRRLINLTLLTVTRDQAAAEELLPRRASHVDHTATTPVYRAG
jgi:hypothetical protein